MPFGILEVHNEGKHVPGTALLEAEEALQGHRFPLKRASGKDADVILIPQPSNDPNDPLNWPLWQRDLILLLYCYCTLCTIGGYVHARTKIYQGLTESQGRTCSVLNGNCPHRTVSDPIQPGFLAHRLQSLRRWSMWHFYLRFRPQIRKTPTDHLLYLMFPCGIHLGRRSQFISFPGRSTSPSRNRNRHVRERNIRHCWRLILCPPKRYSHGGLRCFPIWTCEPARTHCRKDYHGSGVALGFLALVHLPWNWLVAGRPVLLGNPIQ